MPFAGYLKKKPEIHVGFPFVFPKLESFSHSRFRPSLPPKECPNPQSQSRYLSSSCFPTF